MKIRPWFTAVANRGFVQFGAMLSVLKGYRRFMSTFRSLPFSKVTVTLVTKTFLASNSIKTSRHRSRYMAYRYRSDRTNTQVGKEQEYVFPYGHHDGSASC